MMCCALWNAAGVHGAGQALRLPRVRRVVCYMVYADGVERLY
jgi:hypothetical protein